MSIEQKINYQLNKYPAVKKVIKRAYQTGMYAISKKIKSEGNITRISPDDPQHEYFFGYYDKSPWDISDRYMLCMKANDTWSDVSPHEKADILLIDTFKPETDENRVKKIAETRAWNVQQACMLQWLGPDFSSRILYNDYRDGKYVSVILTLETMEEKVIPAAVYSVSSDGKFALTLDFSRLYELRPGYGYYNVPEKTKGVALPDSTAIWKVDLETGEVTDLLKYTDFANFQPRPEMKEAGAVHKVNHIMLSPNGKRFMVLYRWFNGQRKYTRLITCNVDGTDMYVLSDDDMVSHCFWKNNSSILAFENKKKGGPGYYLMKDKTDKYIHCWPQFSNDGHPSYSPDGSLIVTDSYPDRARVASINLMDGNERKRDNTTIARVFAPFKYDNDTRCDLHPRWNHAGDKICFDSIFEGHRGLYVVDLKENREDLNKKINIAFLVTACKKSGPIEQMLSIFTYMDRDKFNPILITLYNEPDDGTSQLQRYLDIGVKHVRVPLDKKDILLGKTKKLRKELDKLNVDIVHALGVFPDFALSRMKYPGHVTTLRNFVYEDYPVKFGKAVGIVMAKMHLYAMKRTAQTWTCSASLARKYKEELKLKFPYIQNGVNVSNFIHPTEEQKENMREKLNLPKDKVILVYAGQFVARKDQKFLLELFSEEKSLEKYLLLLLGDGADYADLKEKYGKKQNVVMTGSVNNVNEYLQASDIYIASSKSEGLPNGVLEAMAVGLPVILSDIEQHKEVYNANPNIGKLYQIGNKKDCLKKILFMDEEERVICGSEAYRCAHEQFSAERMSKQYQTEYIRIYRKKTKND
ncbi:glycosyltransferase [uncultured Clostridium sp.]|uniref:glycosyltransferase n=1 Tax=uncultured Clostridium sp. TaxID=59620 RepID=UPI0025E2DCC2|nr:glycosyltransferase [uncultured Clostridium sp.]